jgi:hypothetical protein
MKTNKKTRRMRKRRRMRITVIRRLRKEGGRVRFKKWKMKKKVTRNRME